MHRQNLLLDHQIDQLNRKAIDRVVERNLQATFRLVKQYPYLRAVYKDIDALTDLQQLESWQPFDRLTLSQFCPPHSSALTCESGKSGIVIRSGGTTGKRKMLYHSWNFNSRVTHLGVRGLEAARKGEIKRIGVCFVSGGMNGAFQFGTALAEKFNSLLFALGADLEKQELLEIIEEAEIDTLFATPSFLSCLFENDTKNQLRSVNQIFYLGEGLTMEFRNRIKTKRSDIWLRSLSYSSGETGPIGYQCHHQKENVHHIHEDAVYVEVVDPLTNRLVKDGETGEILVTTLLNDGMPLFRYRIGDMGRILETECSCGSKTKQLELLGRTNTSIKIGGLMITVELLKHLISPLGDIPLDDIQLAIHRQSTRYSLHLNLARELSEDEEKACRQEFYNNYQTATILKSRNCLGLSIETKKRTQFLSSAAGKTPTFIEKEINQ